MQTLPGITDKSESKEYRIVRLSKTNLADVAKLHAAVYGVEVDADYFPRKYNTGYTGVEYVGVIAYNAGNIPVAYYGVIPCFIEYGNMVMLAAQSADTMTDPRFRYKGMFVELSNITFGLCRELGITLVFGFPNQNSYHGAVNKLGWKMTEMMKYFTIPVSSLPLESISRKSNLLKKWYDGYKNFILNKKKLPFRGIANSAISDGYAGLCRNEVYLEHKTYNETKVLEMEGAKIWVSTRYGLMIGDMEGVNKGNFNRVIKGLRSMAAKLGVRQVQFHCCSGTALYTLFAADFPAVDSYPVLFQDFGSVVPPEKIKFSFADIDIF